MFLNSHRTGLFNKQCIGQSVIVSESDYFKNQKDYLFSQNDHGCEDDEEKHKTSCSSW
jgi:hypothetical protein